MDYTIIDAHAHLWLRQDTVVDGLPIWTYADNGRSLFMGRNPSDGSAFMMDGVNSAEVFFRIWTMRKWLRLSAQGLLTVFRMNICRKSFPLSQPFLCFANGVPQTWVSGQAKELIATGLKLKIPAQRLLLKKTE